MTEERSIEQRFAEYVREDAERWYAVHARVEACREAFAALVEVLAPDAKQLRDLMAALPSPERLGDHPAFRTEIAEFRKAIEQRLGPHPA